MQNIAPGKRPKPNRRGYAAPPGTGPAGKTCADCLFKVTTHTGSRKSFPKCWLRRGTWNSSYGTDILVKSPACKFFTEIPGEIATARAELKAMVDRGTLGVYQMGVKLGELVERARIAAVDAITKGSKSHGS